MWTLIFRTNHLNSKESISEKIKKNETANIKQQVEICRNRVECMLKMNCQLQSELKKTVCFWHKILISYSYYLS